MPVCSRFDKAKAKDFQATILSVLNGGTLALMMSIGHKTGLFDSMDGKPPRSSAESRALQLRSACNARPRWASTSSNRLAQAGAVSSGRPSGTTISRIRCSPPRPALRAAAQARNSRTISPCANLSRPDAMLFTHLLSCE